MRLSADGLRRTLYERVDRIFVGRDFCDGARSQPFSRRLFDQVERGDSSEGDDDQVGAGEHREPEGHVGRDQTPPSARPRANRCNAPRPTMTPTAQPPPRQPGSSAWKHS